MVVVLPAPFGPKMPVTAPGAALSVSPSTAVVWPYRLTSLPISTAGTCGTVLTDASLRRQQPAQRGGVDDLRPPREDPAQQDVADLLVGILGAVGQLLVLYDRVDGLAMLRMMGGSPASHDHDHIDALASCTD